MGCDLKMPKIERWTFNTIFDWIGHNRWRAQYIKVIANRAKKSCFVISKNGRRQRCLTNTIHIVCSTNFVQSAIGAELFATHTVHGISCTNQVKSTSSCIHAHSMWQTIFQQNSLQTGAVKSQTTRCARAFSRRQKVFPFSIFPPTCVSRMRFSHNSSCAFNQFSQYWTNVHVGNAHHTIAMIRLQHVSNWISSSRR